MDAFVVRRDLPAPLVTKEPPIVASFQSTIVEEKSPTATQVTRRTLPIMTKYERANAIGTRARQIGMNYPVFVNVSGMEDEVEMARKELLAGKCPLIVRRMFPDHTSTAPHFEDWYVWELSIF